MAINGNKNIEIVIPLEMTKNIVKQIDDTDIQDWMNHEIVEQFTNMLRDKELMTLFIKSNAEYLQQLGYIKESDAENSLNFLNFDLSGLDDEKKQVIIDTAMQTAGELLARTFISLGLKKFMRCRLTSTDDGKEYELSFVKLLNTKKPQNEIPTHSDSAS